MSDRRLVQLVAGTLDTLGVRYAVVGAAALAAHGIARSTFDLDLLTTSATVLQPGVWDSLSTDECVRVEVRKGDADDPLLGLVRVEAEGTRPVDVVVGRWPWQTEILARATPVEIDGVALPLVTASDLVLLKLFAGGSQDCWDIEQLLAGDDRESVVRDVESLIGSLPTDAMLLWQRLARGR